MSSNVLAASPARTDSATGKYRSATIKFGWMLLGATAYYLQDNLTYWLLNGLRTTNWAIQVIFFINCLSLASLAWICARWISRMPDEGPASSLWWRMTRGGMAFLTGSGIIFIVLYWYLFPLLVGRNSLNQFHFWSQWTMAGLIAYVCLGLYDSFIRQAKHTLHVQLETALLSTALDRAELAMLEAQIEPHFLFNTLAHIKRQYRHNAATADHMLSGLIDYLDRAAPALRRADWTVDDEMGLVRVYLDILRHRFGNRLEFSITVATDCKAHRLPALTVATLVENAVRHGLTPKEEGGTIAVSAEMDGTMLRIDVSDDGIGLRKTSGSGLGLATVRARLQSVCGNGAQLRVQANQPCGTLASIWIPGDNIE